MDGQLEIVETADGSKTLLDRKLNETYHSSKGALTESEHVFIKEGLKPLLEKESLHVLEVGFGTGLNALLSCREADHHKIPIHYVGLETHPLLFEQVAQLHYPDWLFDGSAAMLQTMHEVEWENGQPLSTYFTLQKRKLGIEHFTQQSAFDLVFFDAFAPTKQPEMWGLDFLAPAVAALRPGGVLVTYSSMGQFRRNLATLGMDVTKIPGPPGKREMVRAKKR